MVPCYYGAGGFTQMSEILKNSIIMGAELHLACILLIFLLFVNMRRSFSRNGRKVELSLNLMYIGSMLMLLSDCLWASLSSQGNIGNTLGYIINLVYFISGSTGVTGWLIFCVTELGTGLSGNKYAKAFMTMPCIVVNIMYLVSPFSGLVFSIQNGAYVRGTLFFLDPAIKLGYIGCASAIAILHGRKQEIEYLKKRDFHFACFGIPVIISGVFQTITGVDFNCLGATVGLVLIYIVGITNQDTENTDAIYSLANSFEASYIVNMDTGKIRPLHEDLMHDKEFPGMKSTDYTSHFNGVLSAILLPEDRSSTLEMYDIKSVRRRFKIDNSFSIRYRVKENSGQTSLHTASFIRAVGDGGKNEFLLGINTIHSDSLLYERNEVLSHENQRLEQINTSIIESVAKIVEARDGGSGAHIIRVRKLTEILAGEIMREFPELNLDEEKVKLISLASVLHDVGKIAIPDAILLKPGRLTEDEFRIMKSHSAKGCDILNMFPLGLDDAFLEYALSICRWHHEKYDGKGYPDGLKGDEIPIAAQIVSVADCFDALVSDRPYKSAFSPDKALEMIFNGECGEFSPKILSALRNQRNRLTELVRLYR